MSRLFLGPPGIVSALGSGIDATRAALLAGDSTGLRLEDGNHHFLFAHSSGVFNFQFFRKSQKLGGCFCFKFA